MNGRAKILVVEDEALIAMELGERLGDLGYDVLGPAMTLDEADRLVADMKPDAALLDANLNGKSSVDLGAKLAAMGVPVAFCTGYDVIKNLPPALARATILTKPISEDALASAVRAMLSR
ncbi:response regulator [Terricaulis sp.]|uniref:response regulator n=1 Tax=Terricaulis sp. TaxID=2768686 RepID=UPI003784EC23